MTLDEAIKHCEEKAEELREKAPYIDDSEYANISAKDDCLECAREHEQLAKWLKELKDLRESLAIIQNIERVTKNEQTTD